MKLLWTPRAKKDLLEIGRFIALDKPEAALSWVGKLQAQARRAADMPQVGRAVQELERKDIREIVVGGYRIVYRVLEAEIHVLTVFEGRRRLRAGQLDLEENDS